MTNTEDITQTLERKIISKIDEVYEKNETINSYLIESEKYHNEHAIINKKISKIKIILHLCELEFEYDEDKQDIHNKLNNILNIENEIIKNIINIGVEKSLGIISTKFKNIKIDIKDLEKKVTQLIDLSLFTGDKLDIRENIKKYNNQLSNATKKITNKAEEIFNDINEKNSHIENNQKENEIKNKEISIQLEELEKSVVQKVTIYDKEFNDLKQAAEEKFLLLEKSIYDKDNKISKLIGLVGNKANIGEYKSYADKAREEKIVWQIITMTIFIIAFTFLGLTIIYTKDYNMTTLIRCIISIILIGMAGYTAKQAGNLKKDETYYRKQQLELSSIDVYLADMPDSIKQNIKFELSNKIFGQAKETYKNKYDDSSNNIIRENSKIIEKLLDILNKN